MFKVSVIGMIVFDRMQSLELSQPRRHRSDFVDTKHDENVTTGQATWMVCHRDER